VAVKDGAPEGLSEELVALLAHDFRSPLGAMLANLHFLASGPENSADAAEAFEDSVALCTMLERYVTNFELLGRQASLDRISVRRVGEVAHSVVRRLEVQASSAGLTVEVHVCDPDPSVEVEAATLAVAMENLVANALEYAPRGSTVRVAVERQGDQVTLTVDDEAPAIPEALREMATSRAVGSADRKDGRLRYSRGAGLLVAHLAAERAGARLELGGDEKGASHRLVAPAHESR